MVVEDLQRKFDLIELRNKELEQENQLMKGEVEIYKRHSDVGLD